MGTNVFGVTFNVQSAAQAFLDVCNAYATEQAGQPDIWDVLHKHPERDEWWVGYATRIDHLLDGRVPIELTCDYLPDACYVMDPPPPEEEPPGGGG